MNLIFGDTECGDWENLFGTIRHLQLVQTQSNLRIRMRIYLCSLAKICPFNKEIECGQEAMPM